MTNFKNSNLFNKRASLNNSSENQQSLLYVIHGVEDNGSDKESKTCKDFYYCTNQIPT